MNCTYMLWQQRKGAMKVFDIISIISIMILTPFAIFCFYINYKINEKKSISSESISVWKKIFLPPMG